MGQADFTVFYLKPMSLSFERGSDGWCQRERDAGSSYDVMSGRSILGSLAQERSFVQVVTPDAIYRQPELAVNTSNV